MPKTELPPDLRAAFEQALDQHGLHRDQLDDLWAQLSHDLRDLPKDQPWLGVLAGFVVGFAAGRMMK